MSPHVDLANLSHIHWYERMWPMGRNGTIAWDQVINDNTYHVGDGKSIAHLVNGQAGNAESHTVLNGEPQLNLTNVLNYVDYGFSKLTVINETVATWEFIKGEDGSQGDLLWMTKEW